MSTLPLLSGRYRLGPVIGTGGMGLVHRAWDETFGREVAVKVVRAGADPVERERLRREAQFLAGLDDANLIAVYDTGQDASRGGESVWFAMELVDGPDLRTVLRRQDRLSTADVARVLTGVAGAVRALHAAGVVHRDLKPANVLLTADPQHDDRWDVKVADLGIARLMAGDSLTGTNQVVGTAAYLSPEQVAGGRIGPASDVYAMGLLAIEALTGEVAFPGGVAESAAARLLRSPKVPDGLRSEWRRLLTEMTARQPEHRPTAVEVLHRLSFVPLSVEPLPEADATAVLPASALHPGVAIEDLPTEAMDLGDTRAFPVAADQLAERPLELGPATGWRPALRPRRRAPKRRLLLGAAAVATAIGLAGGGAAIVGAQSPDDHAAALQPSAASASSAPASPSTSPSTASSKAPGKTASKAKSVAADEPATPPTAEASKATKKSHRFRVQLKRFRERLEEQLHFGR